MANDKDTIQTLTAQIASLQTQLQTAYRSITEVSQERDGWQKRCVDATATNAAMSSELLMANARIAALSVPLPGKPFVDDGAADLAAYMAARMPGLQVSTKLGGPALTDPHREIAAGRETMTMELQTTDGRLYKIEVFRVGHVG